MSGDTCLSNQLPPAGTERTEQITTWRLSVKDPIFKMSDSKKVQWKTQKEKNKIQKWLNKILKKENSVFWSDKLCKCEFSLLMIKDLIETPSANIQQLEKKLHQNLLEGPEVQPPPSESLVINNNGFRQTWWDFIASLHLEEEVQNQSEPIRANQNQSEPIRTNQNQSEPIRTNHSGGV